jgi:AcrR family transcriptional regulator
MSPRSFSDAEREVLQGRLLAAAADHFARFGYRKSNVADIARQVAIGKGTLYLFFASKAELFVGTVLEVEKEMRARLLQEMRKPYPSPRDRLRHFFQFQLRALTEQPLLAVMVDPEEAASLMRDLPMEKMEELRVSDERFYASLAKEWQEEEAIGPVGPGLLAALSRVLFAMTLQRSLIGEEVFADVADFVIESMAAALAPGKGDDKGAAGHG